VKRLSTVLICVGVVLIAFSGWQLYRAGIDPQSLVEVRWENPGQAIFGQETPAPIRVTNRSSSPARIVGLNHC
jgi:hypothetical protein